MFKINPFKCIPFKYTSKKEGIYLTVANRFQIIFQCCILILLGIRTIFLVVSYLYLKSKYSLTDHFIHWCLIWDYLMPTLNYMLIYLLRYEFANYANHLLQFYYNSAKSAAASPQGKSIKPSAVRPNACE